MRKAGTIITVLGTRPEIIKLYPLLCQLPEICERSLVIHTGQHYSYEMDRLFFEELQLPDPHFALNSGAPGLGPSEQTGRMLSALEPILQNEKPQLIIVQGDTNSTLAGTLAAVKLGIPVLHLEAGCRSFNRNMPEELNRVMVDHVAQLLLAPDKTAVDNLIREGCNHHASVYLTGSTGLEACRKAAILAEDRPIIQELDLHPDEYLVLTLHRAENTTPEILPGLVRTINGLAQYWRVVFPVHPRTAAMLEKLELTFSSGVTCLKPLGYLDMLQLSVNARAVLTDSGGLQEEAAALGTPVLVMRNETEWTYLVEAKKAALIGNNYPQALTRALSCLEPGRWHEMRDAVIPVEPNITGRILKIISDYLISKSAGATTAVA